MENSASQCYKHGVALSFGEIQSKAAYALSIEQEAEDGLVSRHSIELLQVRVDEAATTKVGEGTYSVIVGSTVDGLSLWFSRSTTRQSSSVTVSDD